MCRAIAAYAGWWALFIIMSAIMLTLMTGAWGLIWGILGMGLLLVSALMWGDGEERYE